MYSNSVTMKLDNFYDLGHFHPHVGKLIAHRIAGIPDKEIPQDFGILIDEKNIDDFIDHLEYQIRTIPVLYSPI